METLTLRTTVTSSMLKKTLMRGCIPAFVGILLIAIGGATLPPESLQFWGLPLLAIGLGLITYGLLPYRKLSRLQLNPDQIKVFDQDHLLYIKKGTPLLSIPCEAISNIDYLEEKDRYGIVLHAGTALFLPYFSRRSYQELQTYLNDVVEMD